MTSKFSDESTTPLYSKLSEDGSYPDLEQIVQHKPTSTRFSRVFFMLNVTLLAFTLILFGSSVRQQIGKLPAQSDPIKETSYYCTQPVYPLAKWFADLTYHSPSFRPDRHPP